MSSEVIKKEIYDEIIDLVKKAKNNVRNAINLSMVYTYYEIGKKIFLEEQKGKKRAGYGELLLKNIANRLTLEFGKGFSEDNLKLMRIENIDERHFYEIEGFKNNWSNRELTRQYDSALYERLAISKNKEENKTIGILLCKDKNDSLVEMTLPENNDQIYASKYLTALPSKEELKSY